MPENTNLRQSDVEALQTTGAAKVLGTGAASAIGAASAAGAASATGASTVTKPPILSGQINPNLGKIIAGGGLQTILNQGTATPTLAAGGGAVALASLDQAVFEENTFSGLSIAALILAESQTVDFIENDVKSGTQAGFWLLSPWEAFNLAQDPQNLAVLSASVAMSYPMPSGYAAAYTTAVAGAAVRLYSGTSSYTDSSGNVWNPDTVQSPLFTVTGGSLTHPSPAPAVTEAGGQQEPDVPLYQSERWGTTFSYTFNDLVQDYYDLTLKFAEIVYTNSATNKGVRVFDVSINGQQVLTNFDIAAAVGALVADDQVFPNLLPNSQNQIVVTFTGTSVGSDPHAKLSAIELVPKWSSDASLGSAQAGELSGFFIQLAQVAEQACLPPPLATVPSALHLRFSDNNMPHLTAAALLVLGNDELLSASSLATAAVQSGSPPATPPPPDSTSSSLVMAGNRLSCQPSQSGNSPFLCTASISQVTQCVVSGNMISSHGALSFSLDDSALASPALAVAGNLFNGCTNILPTRYPANSQTAPPAPMNTWDFLNTVTNCFSWTPIPIRILLSSGNFIVRRL